MNKPQYAVLAPTGRIPVALAVSHREDASDELQIAFVWDYLFRGDEVNAAIRERIAGHRPGAVFHDHDVFGDIHGSNERQVVADIPDKMLEYRVSAAIVGVGA